MTYIADLAKRCVAATEPDRELDVALWLAFTPGSTRRQWSYEHKATGKRCDVDETRDGSHRLVIVPAYTESFDAALTLLPEGWWLQHACEDRTPTRYAGERHEPMGTFTVNVQSHMGGRLQEARAATLATAMCAAAVHAREVSK